MDIQNYTVNRAMGQGKWSNVPGLAEHEQALNEIGYTGKLNNIPMTVNDYLQQHFTGNTRFKAVMTKSNSMEFTDTFLVTKVVM